MKEIYEITGQEAISLSEVKNYLKVDFDNQDLFLNDLIKTVRESAEKILNRHITRKTIRQVNMGSNLQVIKLIHAPVIQINSISIIDNDKKEVLLDKSEYYIDKFDSIYITKLPFLYSKVITSYDVGYQEHSMIPTSLKVGMLMHIASIYDGGELLEFAPKVTLDLYQPYRKLNF